MCRKCDKYLINLRNYFFKVKKLSIVDKCICGKINKNKSWIFVYIKCIQW